LKPHVRQFLVFYFLATIAIAIVATLLKLGSSAGLNFAAVFGAGYFAASKFVKAEGREPSDEEKKTLAWQGLLGTWVISLVLVLLVFVVTVPFAALGEALVAFASVSTLLIMVFAFSFISVLYYFAIRWSFSAGAKAMLKAEAKAAAKAAAKTVR
jgi:hypothetical protein